MRDDMCTCGKRFLTAEDFRDHMPCEGSKHEQEVRSLKLENKRLREGIELIKQEAECHEDVKIESMAQNLLDGKDAWFWSGG